MNVDPRRGRRGYDLVVAVLGGSAVGWFAWWFTGSYGSGSWVPLVVWEGLGVAGAAWVIHVVRRSPSRRGWLIHLLWIPVGLFVFLMVAVVIALRNWQ